MNHMSQPLQVQLTVASCDSIPYRLRATSMFHTIQLYVHAHAAAHTARHLHRDRRSLRERLVSCRCVRTIQHRYIPTFYYYSMTTLPPLALGRSPLPCLNMALRLRSHMPASRCQGA